MASQAILAVRCELAVFRCSRWNLTPERLAMSRAFNLSRRSKRIGVVLIGLYVTAVIVSVRLVGMVWITIDIQGCNSFNGLRQ